MNPHLKMLDEAEDHFNKHQFIEGAHLVWTASLQAVVAAAKALDLPCDTNGEAHLAAESLDRIRPNDEFSYATTLLHASLYPQEAATHLDPTTWQWEPEEYIESLYNKRLMIAALTAIAHDPVTTPELPLLLHTP